MLTQTHEQSFIKKKKSIFCLQTHYTERKKLNTFFISNRDVIFLYLALYYYASIYNNLQYIRHLWIFLIYNLLIALLKSFCMIKHVYY